MVIVAGEVSGDELGATLIRSVREVAPSTVFRGVTGPAMRAEGCLSDAQIDDIAVMGITDVLWKLPRLLRLRKALLNKFLARRVDLFVGIDAPEFNFHIEKKLKSVGILTAHYVCPQVWAWRQKRAKKYLGTMDRMLALFPFEVDFFQNYGVKTTFVGHPLANKLPLTPSKRVAKHNLNFKQDRPLVALMPGSRHHEVLRHLQVFLQAAEIIKTQLMECQFILNLVKDDDVRYAKAVCSSMGLKIDVCTGKSSQVLTASDAAIVASGTVTLESFLCGTPMVVGYKLAPVSYFLIKRLVTINKIALPNILSGASLVPEFIQAEMTAENLANGILFWLNESAARSSFFKKSREFHQKLGSAEETASDVVIEMLNG